MMNSTIWVVDDDQIYLFVIKKMLNLAGFSGSIEVFKNGKKAFEAISAQIENGANLPDLILLDINMPVWDGWDFLDHLLQTEHDKKLKVYIVTSSQNPDDIHKAEEYEVIEDFLVKPIEKKEMNDLLQQLNHD
mgnify:FL=1